jgi:hypothetical protein
VVDQRPYETGDGVLGGLDGDREAGLTVAVEATEHTIPGLIQALIDHVGNPG